MRRPSARTLVLCAVCGALLGCPEEREGATREIPSQRIPPAMSLEPQAPPPAQRPASVTGEAHPAGPTTTSSPPPRRQASPTRSERRASGP